MGQWQCAMGVTLTAGRRYAVDTAARAAISHLNDEVPSDPPRSPSARSSLARLWVWLTWLGCLAPFSVLVSSSRSPRCADDGAAAAGQNATRAVESQIVKRKSGSLDVDEATYKELAAI